MKHRATFFSTCPHLNSVIRANLRNLKNAKHFPLVRNTHTGKQRAKLIAADLAFLWSRGGHYRLEPTIHWISPGMSKGRLRYTKTKCLSYFCRYLPPLPNSEDKKKKCNHTDWAPKKSPG